MLSPLRWIQRMRPWLNGREGRQETAFWIVDVAIVIVVAWLGGWLQAIPGSFWGVAVGSGLTLIGIARTNRAAERRQRQQFLDDIEVRRKDKEFDIKKEVILASVVSLQRANRALIALGDLSKPLTQISEAFQTSLEDISRLYVVTTHDTVESVQQLLKAITLTFIEITPERVALEVISNQRDASINALKLAGAEFEESRRLHDGSLKSFDPGKSAPCYQRLTTCEKALREAQQGFQLLDNRQREKQAALTMRLLNFSLESIPRVTKAILAGRAELGVPTDGDRLESTFLQMGQDIHGSVGDLDERVKKALA